MVDILNKNQIQIYLVIFVFETAYEKFISEDHEALPSLVCAITGEYKISRE